MSERTSESSEKPSFQRCFSSVAGLRAVRGARGQTSARGWIRDEEERLAAELGLGAIRLEEWRWGRAAAACVLPAGAWVGRDAEGAPVVHGAPDRVTLSHTRRWVAAAAGELAALGIDVCDVVDAERVRRALPRFAGDDVALLADANDATWAAFWAVKEAAAKALGVGLFDGGLKASRILSLEPLVVEGLEAALEDWGDAAAALVWRR